MSKRKDRLDPVHPGRARILLRQGKAAVLRMVPFTIILKTAVPDTAPVPLRLKLDPGSRTTGMALINDATGAVVYANVSGPGVVNGHGVFGLAHCLRGFTGQVTILAGAMPSNVSFMTENPPPFSMYGSATLICP